MKPDYTRADDLQAIHAVYCRLNSAIMAEKTVIGETDMLMEYHHQSQGFLRGLLDTLSAERDRLRLEILEEMNKADRAARQPPRRAETSRIGA